MDITLYRCPDEISSAFWRSIQDRLSTVTEKQAKEILTDLRAKIARELNALQGSH